MRLDYEFTHTILLRGVAVSNLNLSDEDAVKAAKLISKLMVTATKGSDDPLKKADFRLIRRPMKSSAMSKIKTKSNKP